MEYDVRVKVAAVQFEPEQGQLDENRRQMFEKAVAAAKQGAKLIVFPEMATSGYVWENREEISPFVESIPGETTDMLSAVASQYDCYIVTGIPEKDHNTGVFYNSAVLIGPEGVVGSYRKTHLFSADPRWAREGKNDIPVFDTPIGRIAILICMDAMYFEPARLAALKGADIMAFPTNWVGRGNKPPSKTWRLRAKENGLYWIAANRWGTERGAQFTGGSAVIDHSGEVIDSLISGDGIVFGEIELPVHQQKQILKNRKPKAYQDILLNTYLWEEGETRISPKREPFDILTISLEYQQSISFIEDQLRHMIQTFTFTSSHRLIILPEITFFEKEIQFHDYQHVLEKIASEFSVYIVASMKMENRRANSLLVGPSGCLGKYSQVHSDQEDDSVKSSFLTVELPFARVGLLTGEDMLFPESYRVLAKQGADIIAASSDGNEHYDIWMQRIWAYENDAILAAAAPPSSEKSMIFLHSQVSLDLKERESQILFQRFTPDMTAKVRRRPFLRRLNHHLYDGIVRNPIYTKAGANS
ncbi:nitrilase-related carbon-nitrogen hydrolase [Bacillus smithii]|uniref:nitrilase-related carbon-nitrogen hydrolase n=1 Tax=Bacillus smithii TaxID=1479 RepID=UPI002E24A978|nr:nitrilase-related carbon-nitrogen hydrolase [Bacillus smithii]